jgi:hypothetical protein
VESADCKYGTAIVAVTTPQVKLTAASGDVARGGMVQFTPLDIDGVILNWSIVETHANGRTIGRKGLLNVAPDELAGSLTVKAEARDDHDNYDTVSVSVVSPEPVPKPCEKDRKGERNLIRFSLNL